MKTLDLFCGASGVARGLMQAGLHVVGVDLEPQPLAIAATPSPRLTRSRFLSVLICLDFIPPGLPPCKAPTALRHAPRTKKHVDLITPTHPLLERSGRPYCIENVVGARRYLKNPTTLCGSMFELRAGGFHLKHHRCSRRSSCSRRPQSAGTAANDRRLPRP